MKNMPRILLGGLVLLMVVIVVLGRWLLLKPTPVMTATSDVSRSDHSMTVTPPEESTSLSPAIPRKDVPLPPVEGVPSLDAVESLRNAREMGDSRAPAVVRSSPRQEPSSTELTDPEAYQRYEARQNERLYRAFVRSADNEIPRLRDQLSTGRQGGLTAEQMAEGEEKLRRIEAMRHQLMSDHPELNRPAPDSE